MKYQSKRVFSLLMTLAMLVSLFSAVWTPAQAATVNYVKDGNYVYNWGSRGTVATFLSPMAESWYDKNNTSYDELSALSGSSNASSVPSSALYLELQTMMESNHTDETSYEDTKTLFKYTDCQNSGGPISSFYSGKEIGPGWDGSWNREHTWPNSKGDESGNGENDIIMLRPTSTSENSSRGNTAYGESSSYYHPNSESDGKYDLRGDVARIMLFVYCRWGNTGNMWGSSGVIESMAVLLKWVKEDPVDTWELGRNDAAQSITGTRNVFVDYPELIFALFDQEVPENYVTPSGIGPGVTYTVTASSNNTSYGTVSVTGKTINATPKSGYMVSGYEIVGGDHNAIVTRDGNAFRVSASSDVSIRINFAPRSQVNVQFAQQGEIVNTQKVYAGDSITLPAYTGTVPEGLSFVGWVATEIEETTEKPTCYTVGSSYTVTGAVTLYALFSRFEGEGAGNSDVYELVTNKADLQIGDKVIICAMGKGVALSTDQKSNNRGEQAVTVDGNSITLVDGVQVITLEAGKNADTYAFNVGNGYLYAASSSSNYLKTEATLSANSSWSISIASNGSATIKATGSFTRNWMRYNNSASLFSCYSSGQADIALYKQQAGIVYYSTAAKVVCDEHTYDNACDAYCNVCGASRTPADHAYTDKVTTAATCGKDGVRTYTCSVCGDSYTESIPATGAHTYDNACDADCNACGTTRTPADHVYVSEVTVAATCGKDGVKSYTCSVCSYNYTEAIPATGDHAYDHACDADCNACGTTRIPADHVYIANCDIICDVCGYERSASAGGETTVTFGADKTQRVEFSTVKQVWQNGALTITNNKTSSSNNVADYTDPVRFYSGSEIIISYPGMTSLVIKASTGSWEATLKAAKSEYDLEYDMLDDVYTITFADPIDSITLIASEQIRAYTITAIGAVAEHTYDDDYDADCNACGAIREVNYNLFDYSGGFSASEDVHGVAFKYTVTTKGMTLHNYVGDYTNATITLNERQQDIKLVAMGAVASNQEGTTLTRENALQERTVIDIPAVYFLTADADTATYAVRIKNIPVEQENTTIYVRPYYVYEIDGVTFVCYGSVQSTSYAATVG